MDRRRRHYTSFLLFLHFLVVSVAGSSSRLSSLSLRLRFGNSSNERLTEHGKLETGGGGGLSYFPQALTQTRPPTNVFRARDFQNEFWKTIRHFLPPLCLRLDAIFLTSSIRRFLGVLPTATVVIKSDSESISSGALIYLRGQLLKTNISQILLIKSRRSFPLDRKQKRIHLPPPPFAFFSRDDLRRRSEIRRRRRRMEFSIRSDA